MKVRTEVPFLLASLIWLLGGCGGTRWEVVQKAPNSSASDCVSNVCAGGTCQ